MSRLLLVLLVASTTSGCAALKALGRGDVRGAVQAGGDSAVRVTQATSRGEEKAKRQCAGLDTQVVPLGEERAIGGAIAVGLTNKYKAHFFIDGLTDKNPVTLAKAAKTPGKVRLPDSEKNDLNAYLSQVGRNLASYSARPEIAWTFGVMNSPTVNAFSAPGGYVYVTTGLLKLVDNEAQLAGVLAHEIGHISGRHVLKSYSQVKYQQCLTATKWGYVLDEVGSEAVPGGFQAAAQWAKHFSGGKFDLDSGDMAGALISKLTDGVIDAQINGGNAAPDEFEADRYAIELSSFAGYDPTEYEVFLKKLPPGRDDHHPPMAERLAAMKATRAGISDFAGRGLKPDNAAQLKVVKR
jgi:hypothetical protein